MTQAPDHRIIGTYLVGTLLLLGLVSLDTSSAQGPKSWEQPPAGLLKGEIQRPMSDAEVPRRFPVAGVISGRHRRLWLVERIGSLHWPKEPELKSSGGKWSGEVNEGGSPPEGRFELLLIDVSDEVSSTFIKWLHDGHRTGSYLGLPVDQLGDFRILDTKRYRLAVR